MKSLHQFVSEKLKISNTETRTPQHNPKDYDSLFALIRDRYNENKEFMDCTDIDVSEITQMNDMFSSLTHLKSIDITGWDTSNVTDMVHMFSYLPDLEEIIGLEELDVSSVTNMNSMFENCKSIETIDISGWDTSNVQSMSHMFEFCYKLKSINGIEDIDTSSVKFGNCMFRRCFTLEQLDLHKWKVDTFEKMNNMFALCGELNTLNLSGWKIFATNLLGIFDSCGKLKDLDLTGWDMEHVDNCSKMFRQCESLEHITGDIENWNMQNVDDISYMFEFTPKLKLDLSNWSIKKNVNKNYAFFGASRIKKPKKS